MILGARGRKCLKPQGIEGGWEENGVQGQNAGRETNQSLAVADSSDRLRLTFVLHKNKVRSRKPRLYALPTGQGVALALGKARVRSQKLQDKSVVVASEFPPQRECRRDEMAT